MTLTPSHRAHPFHRREGGLTGFDHDHGRGLGGDPEPGTYNTHCATNRPVVFHYSLLKFIQGAVQINDLMPNACWKPQCERLQFFVGSVWKYLMYQKTKTM